MIEAFIFRHAARQETEFFQPLHELDSQINELDQLVAKNSEDANAYYERGKAKYTRTLISGEPVEKRPLFGDDENINVAGGTITVDNLNLENVIADLDQAISINPEFAAAYHMRGLAHHLCILEGTYPKPRTTHHSTTNIDRVVRSNLGRTLHGS